MPELPEVETIRRDLNPELAGRVVTGVAIQQADIVLPPDDATSFGQRLEGRRILGVGRRAKYLLFHLEGGSVLQVQLRMTGRFALGRTEPDPVEFRHIAARLRLDDGRTLFYDDVRRLGGLRLLESREWERQEAGLGPEPLEPGYRAVDLERALATTRAPVKNALMDQRRVAGVGNIYASEALFRAGVDPRRPGRDLDRADLKRLHRAVRQVLREALRDAGTSFRNYRAVNGRSGSFQTSLRVYGRQGEPCRRCGSPIERIVQAGRSTFYCPSCQH
ncbi:MAG: bifunctional DNA-formamidopyrimidine glycosylase/DNA-(apurinic or apyrimidinic site) lyase [Candidatus Palauibacterales bacterium]|nr:bifunctional DNA-formamidopyrimidine glycosylase/DNA-(apurinic or apyrimidinic site) lyase [Candidatus Palauibacterales bacterium]